MLTKENVSYNRLNEHLVIENHPADSRVKICEDNIFQTLSSRMGTGGNNVPMVMESYQETTGSLCASGYSKLGTQEAANDMYVVQGLSWDGGQISPTLTANNANGNQRMPDKDNFNAVVQSMEVYHCTTEEDKVQTLKARDYKDPQCVQSAQNVVRRLTPTECSRLQGYPDGWYDIGDWTDSKGKLHKDSDSAKYTAAGNSIALPFWQWLAERICAEYDRPVRMASLFDGIGGFPLVFSRCGAEPVWASEIEEFGIAVTKQRFPENGGQENETDFTCKGI